MTTTAINAKAAVVKKMSTRQLIETFIMTGKINNPEIPTVRGWIMDELEARNPDAFDAWLDGDCEDASLWNYFDC